MHFEDQIPYFVRKRLWNENSGITTAVDFSKISNNMKELFIYIINIKIFTTLNKIKKH